MAALRVAPWSQLKHLEPFVATTTVNGRSENMTEVKDQRGHARLTEIAAIRTDLGERQTLGPKAFPGF